jgi:hypothetical protein
MFEQLEKQHNQVYGDFERRRLGACPCRVGKQPSYIIRGGELGCKLCLRPQERKEALHLESADLLPA